MIRVALDGPVRFTEIRGAVRGLSARLLAERLRELEEEGIVERLADDGGPVVRYRLTDKGQALALVIRELQAWADSWSPA